MKLAGKNIVITGAGGGIGAALAHRFAQEDPHGILVADIDPDAADEVARSMGGIPCHVDVADESDVDAMIARARSSFGPVDLLCLNAGIATAGDVDTSDEVWHRTWNVNVMSHVYGQGRFSPKWLPAGGDTCSTPLRQRACSPTLVPPHIP